MKAKKKTRSSGSGTGGAQRFLIEHGEKIAVGVLAVVALWFALQGLGYQSLPWQPTALEEEATQAETAIRNNTRTAEDEGIEFVNHAEFAEQIREPIPADPYRNLRSGQQNILWNSEGFSGASAPGRSGSQSMDFY